MMLKNGLKLLGLVAMMSASVRPTGANPAEQPAPAPVVVPSQSKQSLPVLTSQPSAQNTSQPSGELTAGLATVNLTQSLPDIEALAVISDNFQCVLKSALYDIVLVTQFFTYPLRELYDSLGVDFPLSNDVTSSIFDQLVRCVEELDLVGLYDSTVLRGTQFAEDQLNAALRRLDHLLE